MRTKGVVYLDAHKRYLDHLPGKILSIGISQPVENILSGNFLM